MDELRESALGTLQYWDEHYKKEMSNFENHGDTGEIWFGKGSINRIARWIERKGSISKKSARFLDLGCGNGMFLIELASKGYSNLYGVDYSEDAIVLAKSIAKKQSLDIKYGTCDILEGIEGVFDVIHDKGTYDAISLNANFEQYKVKYLDNIRGSLSVDGFFIITSCNWTKDELIQHFHNNFVYIESIATPQFQFGGNIGNVVATLIFQKNM